MPDNASMNLRDIAARRKAVLDREEAIYKEMTAEYNREYHEKVREFTPSKTVWKISWPAVIVVLILFSSVLLHMLKNLTNIDVLAMTEAGIKALEEKYTLYQGNLILITVVLVISWFINVVYQLVWVLPSGLLALLEELAPVDKWIITAIEAVFLLLMIRLIAVTKKKVIRDDEETKENARRLAEEAMAEKKQKLQEQKAAMEKAKESLESLLKSSAWTEN